jgi:hypothetical protein
MPPLPVIAITLGDPAGIGPEVIAKTLRDPRLPKGFRFVVLGKKSGRGIHPAHDGARGGPGAGASRAGLPGWTLRRDGDRAGAQIGHRAAAV